MEFNFTGPDSMITTKKLVLFLTIFLTTACSDSGTGHANQESVLTKGPQGEVVANDSAEGIHWGSIDEIHKEVGLPVLTERWTGDLDELIETRVIRVLTVYGAGTYYIDQGQEKGIVYELFKMFETELNKQEGRKTVRLHVIFIPVARDELIPGLLEGRGDIAAAGLTITPEREEWVDFTNPITRKLSEVLVTGPSAPAVSSIEDLSGKDIYVRASSSYRASLDALNLKFADQGLEPIRIQDISEVLEDEDILELVSNGSLEWAVVDDFKGKVWAGVFENLTVREDLVFRKGGKLGYAIRKDSPRLMALLNRFVKSHRQGTLKGNILINRYFRDYDWTSNALDVEAYERFLEVSAIFEKYGSQYGFDYLMVAAQGYQESRLDQNARSKAGAIGIMQMLPTTAADKNVGIPDILDRDSNIHAGVKYLGFIRNRYFGDTNMDILNRTYFSLAAYNAGPARVASLRQKAAQQGYDPNVWFDNVEVIAAKEIGSETVSYVSNIVKYFVVYRLSLVRALQRLDVRESMEAQ